MRNNSSYFNGNMGSTYAKPSITNEIRPFLPYLCAKREGPLVIDQNVKLIVKTSKLPSRFIDEYNKGLFTKRSITKGTIICSCDNDISRKMNDGMVNLEPLLLASNSEDTYAAWVDMKNKYYDLERAKEVVNVRMVGSNQTSGNNVMFFETIQDVPEGSELLRMYGFTTWTLELFNILTNKNIAGFAKFIQELDGTINGDPYEDRVRKLRNVLKLIVPDNDIVDLSKYDRIHELKPLVFLGAKLQTAYIMSPNE